MNTPQVPDERLTGFERFEQAGAMTVSAEQVSVATEWTVSGRVRLRRQIETRTETIQVTLRLRCSSGTRSMTAACFSERPATIRPLGRRGRRGRCPTRS